MSWYSIFYWISVADNMRSILDSCTTGCTIGAIISVIALVVFKIVVATSFAEYANSDTGKAYNTHLIPLMSRLTKVFTVLSISTSILYIFLPSRKDCLTIIAGGVIGNFVSRDSSTQAIPHEAMKLLRDKIKELQISDTTAKK